MLMRGLTFSIICWPSLILDCGKGSSLVGVYKIYFTLMFWFWIYTSKQIGDLSDFPFRVSILARNLEFSIDIFGAIV